MRCEETRHACCVSEREELFNGGTSVSCRASNSIKFRIASTWSSRQLRVVDVDVLVCTTVRFRICRLYFPLEWLGDIPIVKIEHNSLCSRRHEELILCVWHQIKCCWKGKHSEMFRRPSRQKQRTREWRCGMRCVRRSRCCDSPAAIITRFVKNISAVFLTHRSTATTDSRWMVKGMSGSRGFKHETRRVSGPARARQRRPVATVPLLPPTTRQGETMTDSEFIIPH